jgi:hypothetical protein
MGRLRIVMETVLAFVNALDFFQDLCAYYTGSFLPSGAAAYERNYQSGTVSRMLLVKRVIACGLY